MRLKEYFAYLSFKPTIDVHTYNQAVDKEWQYLRPSALLSEVAIAMFYDANVGLVNFLNLDARKRNEAPKSGKYTGI
jgi:hypothetical protein